jgi:hypothetical protein
MKIVNIQERLCIADLNSYHSEITFVHPYSSKGFPVVSRTQPGALCLGDLKVTKQNKL